MRNFTSFRSVLYTFLFALLAGAGLAQAQAGSASVLKPAEVEKIFPPTVFYSGQCAPAQLRNAAAVKFADGHFLLAGLVDTTGYNTGVSAKYQGYLLSEVAFTVGGKTLAAGAYGFGFLASGQLLITDLGGAEVLSVKTQSDATLERPRPLAFTVATDGAKLYAGRNYVLFAR